MEQCVQYGSSSLINVPPVCANTVHSSARLHECEIGLQVNPEGEEVTRGQEGVTIENSTPLTGFVQHGVLTVEHA